MPTPTHAFGRTRSGRSPWPISIAAGVVAGMICALAAAAVNGGTSAWRLGLAIFAATAPMLTAGVWAVVVDRSTIRGAAARPEQSVEAAWLDRAAAAGFMDVLALAGLGAGLTAIVPALGELRAWQVLTALWLFAMVDFGVRYQVAKRRA